MSFGSSSVNNNATITLDGLVETGVFNEQFIGFGRDFGTFVADTSTSDPVDVARQNLVYDPNTGLWQRRSADNSSVIDQAIVISEVSSFDTNQNNSSNLIVRSHSPLIPNGHCHRILMMRSTSCIPH